MRPERYTLDVQTSGEGDPPWSGEALPVENFVEKYVQTSGTFTATVQLQGSIDGSAWFSVGSAITGAGLTAVTGTMFYLRPTTTAYTSGTPVLTFAGLNSRTEM